MSTLFVIFTAIAVIGPVAIFVDFFVRVFILRKNPALLAELSELREEIARLREENEQLRKGPDAGSTGIREM